MTAIYRDPATYELLFMERRDDGRWIPCMDAMEAWRTNTWRLYQTGPDDFATMPDYRRWPLLPPAEEANIDHLLVHPWIPDGAALDVNESDLSMTDLLIQLSGEVTTESDWEETPALLTSLHVHHTHHHVWTHMDTVLRPALVWDSPFLMRPHAPAPLLVSAAATEQEQENENTIAPLPKHIANLVIRDAETRGAICPISMEPIKAVEASVTSCGHVFQTAAIRHWISTGHDTCPECRQTCSL